MPAKAYTCALRFNLGRVLQFNRESSAANVIRAVEPGRLRIGERWYDGNIIVGADNILEDWALADPLAVTRADLAWALDLEPRVILLGLGLDQPLPDLALMAEFAAEGIGLEIMSTPAACRTYNVLVHEAREVVAALYNPPSTR
jgi:uncharacterized protein